MPSDRKNSHGSSHPWKEGRIERTMMFSRTFVNRPKNPFQSPGTHSLGWGIANVLMMRLRREKGGVSKRQVRPAITDAEGATQPNMPPWALIMRRPISWNSGKYD